MGITEKNIIIKACAVIITLYNWKLPNKIPLPGADNSILINADSIVPTIPLKPPKIKYKVPISLWFVEYNHRNKNFRSMGRITRSG